MTSMYGIKNCDTIKKARRWMDANDVNYTFHDLREDGISKNQISEWLSQVGADKLVNRRSTTWKQLSKAEQQHVKNNNIDVVKLLLVTNPTLIKRPLIEHDGNITLGFKPDDYAAIFS